MYIKLESVQTVEFTIYDNSVQGLMRLVMALNPEEWVTTSPVLHIDNAKKGIEGQRYSMSIMTRTDMDPMRMMMDIKETLNEFNLTILPKEPQRPYRSQYPLPEYLDNLRVRPTEETPAQKELGKEINQALTHPVACSCINCHARTKEVLFQEAGFDLSKVMKLRFGNKVIFSTPEKIDSVQAKVIQTKLGYDPAGYGFADFSHGPDHGSAPEGTSSSWFCWDNCD